MEQRRLYIWGLGIDTHKLVEVKPYMITLIDGFIVTQKEGINESWDKSVYARDEINWDEKPFIIISTRRYGQEISRWLEEYCEYHKENYLLFEEVFMGAVELELSFCAPRIFPAKIRLDADFKLEMSGYLGYNKELSEVLVKDSERLLGKASIKKITSLSNGYSIYSFNFIKVTYVGEDSLVISMVDTKG